MVTTSSVESVWRPDIIFGPFPFTDLHQTWHECWRAHDSGKRTCENFLLTVPNGRLCYGTIVQPLHSAQSADHPYLLVYLSSVDADEWTAENIRMFDGSRLIHDQSCIRAVLLSRVTDTWCDPAVFKLRLWRKSNTVRSRRFFNSWDIGQFLLFIFL